jgi:hypothetical protein
VTVPRSGYVGGEKALQESVRPEPAAAKPFRRRWLLLPVAAIAAAALLIASI